MALLGASKPAQLTENLGALSLTLSAEHIDALDRVSAPDARMLYSLFTPGVRSQVVFGGASVAGYRERD